GGAGYFRRQGGTLLASGTRKSRPLQGFCSLVVYRRWRIARNASFFRCGLRFPEGGFQPSAAGPLGSSNMDNPDRGREGSNRTQGEESFHAHASGAYGAGAWAGVG